MCWIGDCVRLRVKYLTRYTISAHALTKLTARMHSILSLSLSPLFSTSPSSSSSEVSSTMTRRQHWRGSTRRTTAASSRWSREEISPLSSLASATSAKYVYMLSYTALPYTVLHCHTLYCTAIHCTALLYTVLHCDTLYCTAIHCTALRYTALNCLHAHKEQQLMRT